MHLYFYKALLKSKINATPERLITTEHLGKHFAEFLF